MKTTPTKTGFHKSLQTLPALRMALDKVHYASLIAWNGTKQPKSKRAPPIASWQAVPNADPLKLHTSNVTVVCMEGNAGRRPDGKHVASCYCSSIHVNTRLFGFRGAIFPQKLPSRFFLPSNVLMLWQSRLEEEWTWLHGEPEGDGLFLLRFPRRAEAPLTGTDGRINLLAHTEG